MVELLIWLLIIAIFVIIAIKIIDLIPIDATFKLIIKLVIGLIVLILILQKLLPMLGVSMP